MTGAVATVNVITGAITVDVPGAEDTDIFPLGGVVYLGLHAEVEPWGEDEFGMGRADDVITDMGWQRTDAWRGPDGALPPLSEVYTAPVVPDPT